jgi:hypothetical protein
MVLARAAAIGRGVLKTCGHLTASGILVGASLACTCIELTAKLAAYSVARLTGAAIDQDETTMHDERFKTFQLPPSANPNGTKEADTKDPHFLLAYRPNTGANGAAAKEPMQVLDEAQTLSKTKDFYAKQKGITSATFPAFGDEAKLTLLAHAFISTEFGCLKEDLLAEDFQFIFPVVGPLGKAEFVEAFSNFKVRDVFPTSRANFYNFKIDPLEPNRLWALSRGAFVQEGTGPLFGKPKPVGDQRSGKAQVNLPPQCFSFSFNENGQVYKMTGGYCVDRSVGDTQGLGGFFGVLQGLGVNRLPFREGKPWNWWTRSPMWEALSLRLPMIVKVWRIALKS